MEYQIKQLENQRESFGDYQYQIFKNGKLIANYWHDYRGDEHWIIFTNGNEVNSPVGRMVEFVEGGGPKPFAVSSKAIEFLNKSLGK